MKKLSQTFCSRWMQQVWNNGNRDAIDEMLDPSIIAHGLAPEPLIGIEPFKNFYDDFQKQFKDIYIDVKDVLSEDDLETVRCSIVATHIPSGKNVKLYGQCQIRVRDGKMIEAWNNFDFLTMWQQLGYKLVEESI